MCTSEKVMLKENEIMIRAKVKLLRRTRTAEGGRTVGTIGSGYKVLKLCSDGFQIYRCTVQLGKSVNASKCRAHFSTKQLW